ncbi:hypothetical protein BDAP_000085 [Binucleata daphniae]
MQNNDFHFDSDNSDTYNCDSSTPQPVHFEPQETSSLYKDGFSLDKIIPKCYKDLRKILPRIDYLHEETLFYIFYNCPGSDLQYEAYKMLVSNKKYYFHVKMNFFVTFQGDKNADGSKRKVTYFDCYKWSKDTIDVIFNKEFTDHLRNLCDN